MGLVLVASTLPYVVLGPLTGLLVERWKKRWTMLLTDGSRAILLIAITLLVSTHHARPFELILGNLLIAALGTLFSPASAVLNKASVEQEQLLAANSFWRSGKTAMSIAGPAVGGFVIGFLGLQYAFGIDALTYVVSFAGLLFVTTLEPARNLAPISAISPLQDIREGFQIFWRIPYARALTPFIVAYNFPMAAMQILTVQFVTRVLHYQNATGATLVGVFETALSIGELVGSIVLPLVIKDRYKERVLAASMTITALLVIGIGFSREVVLITVLYFIAGCVNNGIIIIFSTGIQSSVADKSLPRVWALITTILGGVFPLSQLLFGALATVVAPAVIMPTLGAIALLGSGGANFHPLVRQKGHTTPTGSTEAM